jgi:hypothetical protein
MNPPLLSMVIKLLICTLIYQEIEQAVSALPPPLAGRVFAHTEGF